MIINPCISICKTDPVTGFCYGCGRTNEDKKNWKSQDCTDEWKEKNLIEEITSSEILQMIKDETITEGMIPKINTCLDAINNEVTAVGIIDGRKKHSILFEIFSDKGSGTLIRK